MFMRYITLHKARSIDCTVFNRAVNVISVITWQPVYLLMLTSSSKYSAQYSFLATGSIPTQPWLKQWTFVREE